MIRRLMRSLRSPTLPRPLRLTVSKILPPRLRCWDEVAGLFRDKCGLELGGPSPVFGTGELLPIYPQAARIDNCNYSARTVWQGDICAGNTFRFDNLRTPGRQYFAEATRLDFAEDASYDFVLSSHMLEHSANPLRALKEWKRIVKPSGAVVLFLPHRDATFDHRRPITALQHLREDLEKDMQEDDLTHLEEILELHDLSMDPEAGDSAAFRARSLKNLENRCLHHHVFDTRLAVAATDAVGLQILHVELAHPFHIAIVTRRLPDGATVDNSRFLKSDASYLRSSPFRSDWTVRLEVSPARRA